MSVTRVGRLAVPVLGLLVGLGTLTACSTAPEVAVPPFADVPVCSGAAWPDRLPTPEQDADRVETVPASPAVAAWGSPAIIARCGLPSPAPTTDPCVAVDGVDWVVRELSDGSAATTYGRDPAVEVLVPEQYGPVPLLLPAFAELARTLPETGRSCS